MRTVREVAGLLRARGDGLQALRAGSAGECEGVERHSHRDHGPSQPRSSHNPGTIAMNEPVAAGREEFTETGAPFAFRQCPL